MLVTKCYSHSSQIHPFRECDFNYVLEMVSSNHDCTLDEIVWMDQAHCTCSGRDQGPDQSDAQSLYITLLHYVAALQPVVSTAAKA